MTEESKPGGDARIPEADVRRILDRAIQLDAERTTDVTLSELQRIADEIGISPLALTQAFDEHQLARLQPPAVPAPAAASEPPGWVTRLRRLVRPAIIGSVGSILGLITAAGGAEEPALITFMMSIAASLLLAVMHRLRRRDAVEAADAGVATADQLREAKDAGWAYQIDLLALWVPWSVLNALAEDELILIGSLTWSIAAVVGMAIVILTNPKPKSSSGQAQAAARPAAAEPAL